MSYADILKIKAFRNLWLGQCISQVGDSLYYVVFMFMVKKITGDPFMVGVTGAVELLPYLLIGPFAGVWVDRWDRRKVMLYSDYICAAILLIFAVLVYAYQGKPPVWSILVTAGSLSVVRVFFMPAKNASIPRVVEPDQLLTANSLSMASQNVVPIIALAFSATVLTALYEWSAVWFFFVTVVLNAISFLGSAVFIARLPAIEPERAEQTQESVGGELKGGLRYLFRREELAVLFGVTLLVNLMISPFFVTHIEANDRWFSGLPRDLALFELAFFLGMVVASAAIGKWKILRPGRAWVFGITGCALAVLAMAYSPFFWGYFLLNVVAGLAIPFAWIPMSTYTQATVPDEFRGRVNSVMNMAQMGVQPLGMAMAGSMIKGFGLSAMFIIMGAGMAVASLVALFSRGFRDARMPEELMETPTVEQEPAGVSIDTAAPEPANVQ